MEESERPLGLGILAVVSFGVALWNIYSAVLLIILVSGHLAMASAPQVMVAYHSLPEWLRWFLLVAAIVKAGFLSVAGVGYFARRRYGRVAGIAYAVVSIAESVAAAVYTQSVAGPSLIGVGFALYTLVALNTMYKAELTR